MTAHGTDTIASQQAAADQQKSIRPPRNRTKAHVAIATRDGRTVVTKDFSRCNILIKLLYGRPSLRREARAYDRLQGVPGIPAGYGLEGKDRLVIEFIPGRLLSAIGRGRVSAAVFDRVDEIVAGVHARGMGIGDLHISNIIVTDAGEVFLIDFANAVFARNPQRPGLLVRLVMDLDRHAARRMRARQLRQPEPSPTGFFGALYRGGRLLKSARRKIKKLI